MGWLRVDRLAGPPAPLAIVGGPLLAGRCHRAATPVARLVGLLGTPDLARDEALWIEPCSGVHTVGMRIPIGCAFLDAEGVVLRVVDPLPPWRAARARGARVAVECAAGVLSGVPVGARLHRGPTRNDRSERIS